MFSLAYELTESIAYATADLECQRICMQNTFHENYRCEWTLRMLPYPANPCDWINTTCDGDIVRAASAYESDFVVSLKWLSPNLDTINYLSQKYHEHVLTTRMLPRRLRDCTLEDCSLAGEVDLRELPRGLETLYISKNFFDGTVCISHLPPNIRVIDLHDNFVLKSVVIDSRTLPQSLESIDTNGIKKSKVRSIR